jgi:hypothetical protein
MLSIAFVVLGCIFAAFTDKSAKALGAFYLLSAAVVCFLASLLSMTKSI